MEFAQVVAARRSVTKYEPGHTITDTELKTLFEKVALTPSSFNLQHARFVVVRDPALKAELRQAAFGQEQVEAASTVIIVAGKLNAHVDAPEIYAAAPQKARAAVLHPAAVSRLTGLDRQHIPVMLIVIGKQAGDIRPRAHRFPIDEFVKLESLDAAGLD
jgi:nitroreductase